MKLTKLGKFIRKKRIENEHYAKDMAEKLGTSSALISAIELGKRKMTDRIRDKFIKEYKLNKSEVCELYKLTMEDCKKIDLSDLDKDDKELILDLYILLINENITDNSKKWLKNFLDNAKGRK